MTDHDLGRQHKLCYTIAGAADQIRELGLSQN